LVEIPRRRAASDALRSSTAIGSSFSESQLTADNLDLRFDLGHDREVIGIDENISGILEGGELIQRLVEAKVNLFRWIESRSRCHAADALLPSEVLPGRTVPQGCDSGPGLDPALRKSKWGIVIEVSEVGRQLPRALPGDPLGSSAPCG
jgi:hypothetical protein